MVVARALLRGAVEVGIARIAALLRRFDEGRGERMAVAQIGHAERPARPMPDISTALVVLGLAEIRQHFLGAPPGVAKPPPVIEVLGLTANIDEAIDRARTAQYLAAGRDDVAVVTPGLRLGRVAPVEAPVGEELAVAERDAQPRMAAVRANLEQQHAMLPRRSQPVGQHAAGAAGADDDEIVGLGIVIDALHSGRQSIPSTNAKQAPAATQNTSVSIPRG